MSRSPEPSAPQSVIGLGYRSHRPEIPGDWIDPASCLICGALIWVPFISAIMAIIFGWFTFRHPRTQKHVIVTVAGLAMAAINLGLWGLLTWRALH